MLLPFSKDCTEDLAAISGTRGIIFGNFDLLLRRGPIPGCLLLPLKGMNRGPGCLLLLAQGLHRGLGCLLWPVYELHGGLGCLLLPVNKLHEGNGGRHELQFGGAGPPLPEHGGGGLYFNKMVVLALPCRDVEEELYCNKMVVLALPCRDMEEELYCNKMVVLFYPSMDREE